ncbi:MAG: glycosyltransferase [Acidobacteriota bacterium]
MPDQPHSDEPTEAQPLLSVVMPVYNERSTLSKILRRVLASPWVGQLIIVDDASKDGTTALLREQIADSDPRIRIVYQSTNEGKGAAIRSAREHLICPFTIIQDADLEYDPADYTQMIGPLLRGEADVVYGSRFRGDVRRVLFFWHAIGNRLITLLSNACTNLNLSDVETCYKAFRTEIFKELPLRSNRFGFEPEVTAKVARLGLRLYEVPISYHGRTYSEGKKIGWRDGLNALWVILREALFGARRDLSDGHFTLHQIAPLHRYHAFLWSLVEPHAGQRIVEVGAGIGNVSPLLLQRDQVWITDVDPTYLRQLRARYEYQPNVEVLDLDLSRPLGDDNAAGLKGAAETVISFNVVEHIEDDLQALRTMHQLLQDDGLLLLLVPAGPVLYGKLDETLEHYRRYRRRDLHELLEKAGFSPVVTSYANAIGALGWWFNGRLLRRRHVPRVQARVNDWLVPWLRLERALGLPFGLSLVVVARRVATSEAQR